MLERIAIACVWVVGIIASVVTVAIGPRSAPVDVPRIDEAVAKAFERGRLAERAKHCQCGTAQYLGKPCE